MKTTTQKGFNKLPGLIGQPLIFACGKPTDTQPRQPYFPELKFIEGEFCK